MADQTPPHHPTYLVQLSKSQIAGIYRSVIGGDPPELEELQRGQSYNNRIYFIKGAKEHVLKVSGHFFDGQKVENEVGCLLQLARYCPEVPVPRVVAWSLDGQTYGTVVDAEPRMSSGQLEDTARQSRSWLLLERLPGQRLQDCSDGVMKQLAGYVHAWRTKIPQQHRFGNIRLPFKIEGLLLCGDTGKDCVITSKMEYFEYRLTEVSEALKQLSAEHWQRLQPFSKYWSRQELVKLDFEDEGAVFTHYDFSPRNILVDGDRVTGIVDFEFAGFFPPEEEFSNDAIGNEGDWPKRAYEVYMDDLGWVPGKSWQRALVLARLIEDIAPWQLRAGSCQGEELDRQLKEAGERVVEDLVALYGEECITASN